MSFVPFAELRELPVVVTLPDGSTLNYYLEDLDTVLSSYTGTVAVLSSGIGAMIILSTVLVIVARSYRSALFWMHQTNFILAISQYSLLLRQYMEPDHNFAAMLTLNPVSRYARNVAIAGDFIGLGVISSLMLCLGFQVYVAYKNEKRYFFKWIIYCVFLLACLQTEVIWLYQIVRNTKGNLRGGDSNAEGLITDWAADALWPSFAATATVGSLMLSWRLFSVARSRAQLGLQQFDAIHIILVAAIQNGTIPALFAILSFHFAPLVAFPEAIGILTTMLCCIFFPVGYIWAQAKRWADICAKRDTDTHSQTSTSPKGTVFWRSLPATGNSETSTAWTPSPTHDEKGF